MAAKVLSSPPHPHPNPLSSRPLKILHETHHQHRQQQPWRLSQRSSGSSGTNKKREVVMSSLHQSLVSTSSSLVPLLLEPPQQLNASSSSISSSLMFVIAAADGAVGYSLASYYTSLGLFVISVPGLWSLIKRSVKSKVVQKTFVGEEKKAPSQVAGEILSFFTRNNFVVTDRGETITGAYYWKRASRKEQIKVKMMVIDDGEQSEIIVQGDDQQVEQMRKELQLSEKGMVYVKGIFER
ncbi:protein COFACTOR ASSEMBLY OF COMPLEX C SUBUNIT B CCB1, chloroplastic-like isoform X2 [Pyrus communis]|uniref:protein COFACTOR ASSEMBLY OF COMPLEX C SUBUNIT B CCB1, chloroplastic-like isoform X2 n=1 Tax=Pyrus communis TaxID=23211 RepID=UPI0035BF9D36